MQYDGLGRITRAIDNGDPADTTQSSMVAHVYDSLGRLVEESLQIGSTGTVRYITGTAWQGEANPTALTYPNGRKVLTTYDALDRLRTIRDDGVTAPIATWRYIGSDRLLEMAYQNGLCLTHLNNTRTASANQPGMPVGELRGSDGVGRVITHRWLPCTLDANGFVTGYTSTTPVIGFRHVYEASDNKLSEEKMHDPGNSEAYDYDSAYRLIEFDRDTLNSALTEVVTPTATPGLLQAQDWTLDGPGNWPVNKTTTGGVMATENRTHNSLNQVTAIDGTALSYDANGNLTDDGTYLYAWDAKNRLRRVTRKSNSVVVGRYAYDAFGRRLRRVYVVGTSPTKTIHYYHSGPQVVEERELDAAGAELLARQYPYGPYLDAAVTLDRDLNGNGIATDPGERLFYHTNILYSVFGLTDASRNFPERYLYDAYGRLILWLPGPDAIYGTADDLYLPAAQSTVSTARVFTGREWDAETELYYFRARYESPRLGRFLSKDPMEFINGPNLYYYVSNRPTEYVDPTGHLKCAAGVVGSIQFCADFCTGNWRIVGWIWAGAGCYGPFKIWYGWSFFVEGNIAKGNLPALKWLPCGECACECEEGWWATGPGFFRVLWEKKRADVEIAGLECGLLIFPAKCKASVETICLLNIIGYLGPIGKIIERAAQLARAEAKAGIVGSIGFDVCPGKRGGIVVPKLEGCLGGFIEIGWTKVFGGGPSINPANLPK